MNDDVQGSLLIDEVRAVMSTEHGLTAKEILDRLPHRDRLLATFAMSNRAEELALAAIRKAVLHELAAQVSFKYVHTARDPMVVEPTYRLPK